ncbi:MAG: hypothetical protein U0229_04990 [Anaeromyxobacter sp.]
MTRRSTHLAAVLAASAAVALSPACRKPPTDEELVRAVFARAAAAAEAKRPGDVVADVSERFRAGDLDRDGARRLAAGVILRGGWVSASVAGAAVRVEGDLASAVVDVVLARAGGARPLAELLPGQASVHRFDVRLAREPDGWRVTAARWRPIDLGRALDGPPEPAGPADPVD